MKRLQTQVLVIGGGATGTGILRDLAMRGIDAILVEKGDLAHGTTGRYHGLLHSGGRYVVKDPQAARECIEENRVLRRILAHCIEDTGGFFVVTPWDDPDYAARFVDGCRQAGIPVEEVPVRLMLREEPMLNPLISRCFRVPDASADSFLAADANAASARLHGARTLPYHKVTHLLQRGDHVHGAICHDLVGNEEIEIHTNLIVNASGAWAGQIAQMAGIKVHIIPGKGVMLAMNHRIVNTVINRCKMPSDGDILVPAHTVSVIGTTDVKVSDPDHFPIEPWEVHLMLEEGNKIVPGFRDMRMLRAWAGVRPLYQETTVSDTRDITRAFVLLDHETRDGLGGLITITSGKWTTYRKMAEVAVDLVCEKLGLDQPCRTHLEPLPEAEKHGYHYLGARLAKIEKANAFGQLICECELATYEDVARSITEGQAKTIDDVRRDVRLGMGPCQGGFCTYRVAGILHELRKPAVEETNLALRDFLQERWKGLLPILWGQQLRQERLDELIYLDTLNADHLPGPKSSRLSPLSYDTPTVQPQQTIQPGDAGTQPTNTLNVQRKPAPPDQLTYKAVSARNDVLIIGAGLSGLTCAWVAGTREKRVQLIAKGWGALYWGSGCIDILGYDDLEQDSPVICPADSIITLVRSRPRHPYALVGVEAIAETLSAFQAFCSQQGYPLHGSLDHNWLLPSGLGSMRPTCLAPETMIAGDLQNTGSILVVGFKGFHDFYPQLIADNLSAQGILSRGISVDLPVFLKNRTVTSRVLANLFEDPEFRVQVSAVIKSAKIDISPVRIGFPAVLGLTNTIQVLRDLENQLEMPVFEIPTLPPSIPGIRLSKMLVAATENAGGRVFDGLQAVSVEAENSSLQVVWSEAAARHKPNRASKYVLATGGILGGGLVAEYDGLLKETVCDLPIQISQGPKDWLHHQFLTPSPHPVFQAGITVNHNFQPVTSDGQIIYENLYAIGTGLSGSDYLRERSFNGVALVTGFVSGKNF